jgi:TBCC domain-containing protein 1
VVAEGEAATVRLLGARRRTLVFRGSLACAAHTAVQIFDCHGCHIYALAAVRSVELVGCTRCTVVVGAVGRVASVHHCDRLTLLATAGALRAHSLSESCLHLCTATRPLLWGENHSLSLAPFAAVYASLPRHMAAAGISPDLGRNRWAQPICCLPALAAGTAPDASACFSLLPPRSYLPFHIPFDVLAGMTAGSRIPPVVQLPDVYAEALASHTQQLRLFSEQLVLCSDSVKSEVGAALQARFREWLVRTGNMRQVVELLAVAPAA